jgi:hypothetical protein
LSDGEIVQGEPQNANKKKKLPLKDKILMGPLDKYQKYSKKNGVIFLDRFPSKFLVHILLVIATTTQVMMLNKSEGQLFRSH